MRTVAWLFLLCVVVGNSEAARSAEAEAGQASSADTHYRIIFMPTPVYPNEPREALVYVRFLISAEGIPVQPEVDDSRSFYDELFKAEALRVASGMRFEPATHNGKPVEAGPVFLPLNFNFKELDVPAEDKTVSHKFHNELTKVARLLKNGDYAGAEFHAEWMLREVTVYNFEYAVLQAQLAQAHAAAGHVAEALKGAISATSRTGTEEPGFSLGQPVPKNNPSRYLLPYDMITYLLGLRMQLEGQTGEVVAALKTYNELAGLKKIKPQDQAAILADKLVALLKSGRPLGASAKLANGSWSHEQYHPSFTIIKVKGKIATVEAHCLGASQSYDYVEGTTWALPSGAKDCMVKVIGDTDSTFDWIELPAGSSVDGAALQ